MLDFSELAVNYVAVDNKGKRKEFRIFFYETIITTIGEYDEKHLPDVTEYMEDVIDSSCGFINSLSDITWYARERQDSDIVEAIKLAVRDGNTIIVIEYID